MKMGVVLFFMFVAAIGGWLAHTFIKIEDRPNKGNLNPWELYGTMAELKDSDFKEAGDIDLNSGNLTGKISSKVAGNILSTEFSLSSENLVKGIIEFDNNIYSVITLSHLTPDDNSIMKLGKNIIQLDNIGNNSFAVILNSKSGKFDNISFKAFAEDKLVVEKAISVNN